MSVRAEAAPRKGRRRDGPSTEGPEPAAPAKAKKQKTEQPRAEAAERQRRKDPSGEGKADGKATRRSRTGDETAAAEKKAAEPKAERKAAEPKAERAEAKAERKAVEPKAERKAAEPRGADPEAEEPSEPEERKAEVDARSETLPEAKVAQASAEEEEVEARLARATDDRPARRGLIVVRSGSRGDGAQLWAVLALAASVIGAGVAIAVQPPEERAPARVEAALQPQAPEPLAAPARPAREAAPPEARSARTDDVDQDLTEAVETFLAAGRERSAIELLASARPSPTVTRARERVLTRAREVLDAAATELRASAGRGEPSAPRLGRLRARLPESLAGELDALAAELSAIERLAAARARSKPAAPETREPTTPTGPEEVEPEPIPVGPLAGRRMPPRPEPTEAEEPSRPEPGPAREPARREPEPEPEPRPEPASEPAGTDEPSPDADAVLADALKDRLKANHRVRGGMLEVDYCFTTDTDRQDWDGRGWDKFEINGVMGLATNHTSTSIALELGAGSNGAGVLHHALELAGDYTLEVGCWVAHSSARSQFVILAGKGGGVRWGTQLVKVSRGGGLKPLGPEPDRMGFRGERDVTIRVVRKGDTLEGSLNGASTGVKTFKPGELDGKVGIFASDVRLVITRFRISGKVDPRKL